MGEQMNSKTNKTPNLNKTVLTYGLSEKQLEIVIKNLPTEDIKVYDVSGCFTDLIAIGNIATIINPAVLEAEDIDDFNQLNEEFFFTYEKVVFVADHPVLELLSSNFKYTVFTDDFEFESKIRYILLEAAQAEKKTKTYSNTLSQLIMVLSEIRRNPYVTTDQLADVIERNPRTVLRHINTLVCAGEYIEYDRKKKGWCLSGKKSVLWGDFD